MLFINSLNIGSVSGESINELNDKINQMEKQQKELKNEQKNLKNNKDQTDKKMNRNINEQDKVKQDIRAIDEELSNTYQSIEMKETEIGATDKEIRNLSANITALRGEIEGLIKRIERREALLKDRLLTIQKNGGNIKYIEVIFGSQSFSDFISRAFAVNTIMDQDKTIMEEHASDQRSLEKKEKEIEEKKATVEKQKASLEKQKKELLTLKKQLDQQMEEKKVLIGKLESEYEELEEYIIDVEEEQRVLSEQEKMIKLAKIEAQQKKGKLEQLAEEKRIREQEAAKQAANKRPSQQKPTGNITAGGSGVLLWPTSGRLSSPYGPRSFNGGGFHYGLDIAAPQGTFVGASASGIVTRADYSSSYGNVVYIYHAELDLTTVYAHLHTMTVRYGEQVSAGSQVGTVGNTGASFGNHLHFETHRGPWKQHSGIDPMQFLK